MDHAAFAAEAKIEETHWWFVVRRELFSKLISNLGIPSDATIVDIGTGTGANLRLLRNMGFTNVTGIDPNAEAAHWCAQKNLGNVMQGDVRALPLADSSVDLVLATDIVEHVDNDDRAVAEIRRVLKSGGVSLFTVPAFPSLWGLQDDQSHHYRRYRMKPFLTLLRRNGFSVEKRFYFNYLLFMPIFLARQLISALRLPLQSENEVNSPFLNRLLTSIFRIDVNTAPHLRPPFGVSILALTRKGQQLHQEATS